MTDIGQRVVRDLRDQLFRHILDQSATFFSRRTTGQLMSRITNDVNQVQQAVSETIGDLLREGLSVVGFAAYLFYMDARLALVAVTGAPLVVYPLVRFGQPHPEHDAQEPGGARASVARDRRGLHRAPHRQGVRRGGARREAVPPRRRTGCTAPTCKVTRALAILPPLMELLGGVARRRPDLVRQHANPRGVAYRREISPRSSRRRS